jgi:hypothetical protein
MSIETYGSVFVDQLFGLANMLVLPFWAAMILLPTWRGTRVLVGPPLVVALLAGLYAVLIAPRLPDVLPVLLQPRLEDVASLLGTPEGATIAWVHFLAFDLFVGRWAYLDSRVRGISAWVMGPVLALVLLVGPLGLLGYLGVRGLHGRAPMARLSPRPLLRALLSINRPLTLVGMLGVATLGATLVGLLVDPRVVTGAPAWLKPAKFALSGSIYAFTFVWLLGFVRGHRRLVAVLANGTAFVLVVEVGIIIAQVVRGTTSHFNYSTPLDAALFGTMAALIVGLWLLALVAAVLLIRQRIPDTVFAWSLRLALPIALGGMAVAFFMPQPTPEQRAALAAGAADAGKIIGAHSVGVPDGGPGLPIVGWSTVGGDLRVAHFVGLHALQVLPVVGWWLSRLGSSRLGTGHRTALVWTAGLTYLGVVLLFTWQALRAQSVIAPDGLTVAAFGALLGSALISIGIILAHARRLPSVVRQQRVPTLRVVGADPRAHVRPVAE